MLFRFPLKTTFFIQSKALTRGETLSGQFSILLTSVWTDLMFGKYDSAI